MSKINQKGFSSLFVILGILVIVGLVGIVYWFNNQASQLPGSSDFVIQQELEQMQQQEMANEPFEELPPVETEPEGLTQQDINQIDALIDSVDSVPAEDLSDLEL